MPSVDAVALPDWYAPEEFSGKNAVVIDVLRASTTVVAALESGAAGVVPMRTVEAVRAYAAASPGVVLGGERAAVRIDGFDLGNSPLEYTRDAVGKRVVALSTTNGTRAIEMAAKARRVLVGALVNRAAVVERLKADGRDVVLVCSGTDGKVSDEDCFAAGLMAELLGGWGVLSERAAEMRDDARKAIGIYGDHAGVLFASFHGQRISKLGLDADIRAASVIDSSACVPMLDDGGVLVTMG